MTFSWKASTKIISSLIVISFLSSAVLPVVVLAEESKEQSDASRSNEKLNAGNTNEDADSDSSLYEEVDTEALIKSESEESVEEIETIDPGKLHEDESDPITSADSEESKPNQTEDKVNVDSEVNEINEEEQVEEQKEENTEDIFSLEDNRIEAMKVLTSLQDSNSPTMYGSLPYTTEFIYNLAQSAVQLGNENGLYPSVMMAQAILETGWGKSSLSKAPNYNLFGIKGNYKGQSVKMKTSEYTQNGDKISIYDYFKKYPSYKESFQDYAAFIRNTKGKVRYRNVWRENASTYKQATAGLVSGGYATDPAYATMLNNIISFNKLDRYDTSPTVSYTTHIQSKGWLPIVSSGKSSGTTGENKRMEAVKLTVPNFPDLGIQYSTHVQSKGWMDWVSDGVVGGTSGENKRMEAIKIKLSGLQASTYDVYYRVHSQSYGWLGWAKNGEEAGTAGLSKRLEALEVKILPKGASAPGTTANSYIEKTPNIDYTTHLQSLGWQDSVSNGMTSGTTGASKRLEAIKIGISELSTTGGIQYRTHVESYGWQDWVNNNNLSGTSGKGKRLEAIQINLTGNMNTQFDVYYRVHAQSYGWLGWAKNGESAGTEGKFKRLEAIEIKLVKKGGSAPGSTTNTFVK